jgi:endoglucanase
MEKFLAIYFFYLSGDFWRRKKWTDYCHLSLILKYCEAIMDLQKKLFPPTKNSLKIIQLLLFFFLLNSTLFPQGFLKTSGKMIVNGNGQEVILKGMGLGGWLVPEGYMLQTSGFANSPTEIRNKIKDLIGEEKTEEFFQLYRKNYVQKKDIDKLKEWGFNSVRLPMHYNLLTPKDQPYVYLEEGFALIDSLLDWCKSNSLYLILDLHCAPGGQSDENISDYDPNSLSLWEDPENKARTVDLWKKLAERYVNEEWIGGYDLLNEPKWNLPPANAPLRELYIDITNAIRGVDQNHILFIEGNWFATDFTGLTPPWDTNMVYSFHKYWNVNNQGSISGYLNLRNTYNIPLWLGETGENSNVWFVELIELLDANRIGWAWWPHKKIESIAGPLSARKNPEYDQLLRYWRGEASAPSAAYAENALTIMANNLNIDNCVFQKDVIDAMFRQVNNNSIIPFAENNIPGIIFGVNYDLGKINHAYRDVNYHNLNQTGATDWNTGWSYRNDGVDIERCNDAISNGFNVGWIETGEYLNYTINILESGKYDIYLRTAGNQSGGKIQLKLNGLNLGSLIDVPNSGGWQSWNTISLNDIELPAGTHTLNITFYFGGFNFNYIEFVKTPVGVEDEKLSPNEFKLEQNFPNPFNPTTKIKYAIPFTHNAIPGGAGGGLVTLKIYDVLGKEAAILVNEEKPAGDYEVEFDAAELPSGVYFYKLQSGEKSAVKKLILMK